MEEDNAWDKNELINILLVPPTTKDLLMRLRTLIDINEISKKHFINPETTVNKRNIQKYLRGP